MAELVSPRRALLLVTLLLLASVVGVGLLVGDSNPSAERPGGPNATAASARLQALDGFSATRTTVIEDGNETRRTVDRVVRRFDGGLRVERVAGPGSVDRIVANESVRWHYDREDGVATRYDRSADPAGLTREIPRLVARLNRTGDGAAAAGTRTPGVSPLPVVPAAGASESVDGPVGAETGDYRVGYEGTATVAGHETYVLTVTGPTGAGPVGNYTQTLWLDTDRYVPLKRQTAWTQADTRTTITTTYANVTLESGLAAERFRFAVPENATVETPETPGQEEYETVAALRDAASLRVPAPDLPPAFALASATRTDGRRVTSVGLRYVNATATVEVAAIEPVYSPRTDGERVTVAGRNATYRDLGAKQSVVWTCHGTQHKVSTTGLGRAGTLAVAASVGCG
jgi:outer membrane lipoprotein-sorting protein